MTPFIDSPQLPRPFLSALLCATGAAYAGARGARLSRFRRFSAPWLGDLLKRRWGRELFYPTASLSVTPSSTKV